MNTLTNLIPDLYEALDVVSRELTGMIPSVTIWPGATRAAVNQVVRSPIAPAATASDIAPAVTPPDDGDQTIGNATVTITKSRRVPVRWNGEQTLGINTGAGYQNILVDQFAQAMRTLTNEVEADLAALYKTASRAYGTAGTTPFGTAGNYSDAAEVRRILVDNGAPITNLSLVLSTAAGAKIRGLQAQAQMAGGDSLQRQGVLLDLSGMAIRESAQIKIHPIGTGASYQANGAQALNATTVAVDTGTGTIVPGDVLTIANGTPADSNKYVVATALSGGNVVIAAPGLKSSHVDNDAVTVGAAYTANLAFARSAIVLAARLPALPEGGDMADDRYTITDPVSGLSFEVSLYRQYRQIQYEIALAWGVANIKPEHTAILLG